ncbi:hypothetical protein LOCC1_G002684 [Lachnellula occidentalis]|uniref:Uncharacterized protein n=1 Tax=Lachnellula occidentalis TaxID=215460 RepID=A0A8H8S7I8_9HELO|nr:hypothetical protein LOCC1_G002684 [Lachnellula occidentalis]
MQLNYLIPQILIMLPSVLCSSLLAPRDQKLSINVYSDTKCADYLTTYKNGAEVDTIATLPYEGVGSFAVTQGASAFTCKDDNANHYSALFYNSGTPGCSGSNKPIGPTACVEDGCKELNQKASSIAICYDFGT